MELKGKIFPAWKRTGPTSHDIVDRIRKIAGIKKVGHAGTLDPLAEGILIIGVGREATKQLDKFKVQEKEYEAEIILGFSSDTDDAQGKIIKNEVKKIPIKTDILKELKNFEGEIKQIPPKYSAIKIKGKTAYSLARKGEKVMLKPRKVNIKKINLLEYNYPKLRIRVICSSGVYIRSIARDLGELLQTGGYISKLTRVRLGSFTKQDCILI